MCMDVSDRIVSMLYIYKEILSWSTYSFITGKSVLKEIEHIKGRIADFGASKEDAGMNEMICNKIQKIISLWKGNLKTVIENNEKIMFKRKKFLLLVEL